jgi:hypothetical protein
MQGYLSHLWASGRMPMADERTWGEAILEHMVFMKNAGHRFFRDSELC